MRWISRWRDTWHSEKGDPFAEPDELIFEHLSNRQQIDNQAGDGFEVDSYIRRTLKELGEWIDRVRQIELAYDAGTLKARDPNLIEVLERIIQRMGHRTWEGLPHSVEFGCSRLDKGVRVDGTQLTQLGAE